MRCGDNKYPLFMPGRLEDVNQKWLKGAIGILSSHGMEFYHLKVHYKG